MVIGLNKQDLIAEEQREELIASYSEALPEAPLLPFSALTGDGCSALVEAWVNGYRKGRCSTPKTR